MLDERLTDLGRRNAEERMLHLFLDIHERQAQRHAIDADGSYAFPLRQEDIADALGLTTVHVSRTLATLKKKGLVILKQGQLTLPDLDAAHAAIERI
jgi:CRP-like cAMP-binding protein